MGFLGELGKGFVRSAVNQVGRDTGKVVSNSIYGDAHATPIRNVNKTKNGDYIDDEGEIINPSELRDKAEKDGWIPKYTSHSISYKWISRIFCFFGWLGLGIISYPYSIALPIVPIIMCFAGIGKIFSRNVTWARKGNVYIKRNDGRYRGGYRIESYSGEEKAKLPCNKTDRKMLLIHGLADFVLAALLYVGASYWGIKLERNMKIEDYNRFLNDSAKFMKDIEWYKEYNPNMYKEKIEEFNKKYQEAIEYIKSNDSIPKY